MKKFLSLVLALVMAMSLVTISAGATEYKDLTDKDEIQYEEAVAVLNRIGIITGYDDGTFRPETELTRGAAAKIIVSLMIGPEAASALPNTYSPYPDVPAGHTFAGVISYCKTAGYISGYGDGTFKPANSLTGFAFAKMLLGALGYKSDLEGFTGTGWTMNVAKLGNAAGLFNRLNFQGAEAVNREEACQLALNTLKGTMVEYTGGFNIVSGDATIVGNQTRTYVTSNQSYAKNIDNRKASQSGNAVSESHYTVEFGEEHFKDLRLNDEHEQKLDDFGRPSNHWSYKKVTIGVFPIEADFAYTTQVTAKNDVKVTKATKIRDLGLNGYEVDAGTRLFVNGKEETVFTNDNNIEKIADYTDNGTLVEVYVDETEADYIRNVVVVQTQLMEVKKIGSDYVTLDKEDDCDENDEKGGFNRVAIQAKVDDVEVEDAYYDFLKGLKAGDKVAVVPLTTDDGDSYTVAKAYTPETVSGSLDGSRSFTNAAVVDSDRSVIEVTVGGTAYKVANWNKDLQSANRDIIKVTKKDVTLLLDEYGNAMLAKDIGSTAEYMILGAWRNSMVDGVLVRLATGWDIKGNAVSLNVGSEKSSSVSGYENFKPGDVLRYTNDGATGTAEWKLSKTGVYEAPGNQKVTNEESFAIKASNSAVTLKDYNGAGKNETLEVASGIKTIYVAFDDEKEVDYIEIKDGLQNISQKELRLTEDHRSQRAEATISKLKNGAPSDASEVTFVVIKEESNDATLKNLGFIWKNNNTTNNKDENGDVLTKYNVFTVDDDNVSMTTNKGIHNYRFVRFKALDEDAGRYDLKNYDYRQRSTSVAKVVATEVVSPDSNNLIRLKDVYQNMAGDKLTGYELPNIHGQKSGFGTNVLSTDLTHGDKYADLINVRGAKFLDLNHSSVKIDDADDLKAALKEYDVSMSIAFNDNPDNDEFRKAYIVVITDVEKRTTTPVGPQTSGVVKLTGDAVGQATISDDAVTTLAGSGKTTASFTLNLPAWAAPNVDNSPAATTKHIVVKYDIYVDDQLWDSSKEVSYSGSSVTTANGNVLAVKDAKGATTSTQGDIATAELKDFEVLAADSRLIGKKVEIRITGITYDEVRVRYQNADGTTPVGAKEGEFLTTATDDTLVTTSVVNATKYGPAYTGAKYTVEGAVLDAGNAAIPETAFTNTANAHTAVHALGTGWVTVKISGLKASELIDATSTKFKVAGVEKALFHTAAQFKDIVGGAETSTADLKLAIYGNAANTCTATPDHDSPTTATGTADSGSGDLIGAAHVGDMVTLEGIVGAGGTHKAAAFKVTYTITNGTEVRPAVTKTYAAGTAVAANSADAKLATFEVKGAISVDVKVEAVAAPKLLTAVYDADKAELTLTFDQKLKEATVTGNAFDLSGGWATDNSGVAFTGVGSDTEKPITIVSNTEDGATIIVRLEGSTAAVIDGTGECAIKLVTTANAIQSIDGIKVKADKVVFTALTSGSKTVTNA